MTKLSEGFGRMLVVICVEEDFEDFLRKGGPCHLINVPKNNHTYQEGRHQDVLEFMGEYGYKRSEVFIHTVRRRQYMQRE